MTRIIYRIIDGWGEAAGIHGSGDPLVMEIAAGERSFVTLDGAVREIASGEAVFKLSEISEGEHTPIVSGEVHAVLEPLRRRGTRIEPLPTPDETVRRLLRRAARLEERVSLAENELSELKQRMGNDKIF